MTDNVKHRLVGLDSMHPIHGIEVFASNTLRNAHTYISTDVGKVVQVTSPLRWWLITAVASGVATFYELNHDLAAIVAHAASHQNGGSDEIATATPGANAIPKAGAGGTLATGWLPAGTTSAVGAVQLEDSTSSTSTTKAATPNSVKGALDAAKAYADAIAQGLSVKGSVLVATTTNVAALSGIITTIDGTLVATPGTRVGLLGQSTASQNGIWVIQTGAWTRPTDFATGSHAAGAFFFVESGTANAASGWTCTTTTNDVVDTNNLSFTQFSGAGEITAGTALSKSGNTLNVVLGTSGSSAAAGNDSRLSDSRTPTAHASSHLPGGSDALTTAAAGTITPGDSAAEGSAASFARSDHTHAIAAFGTASGTFCQGNDSRLSGGAGASVQERWTLPTSPNSDDDEFSATSLAGGWALYNNTATLQTITDSTIDPYANNPTNHHVDCGVYRPHWMTAQVKADGTNYYLTKRRSSFPTNCFIWTRISMWTSHGAPADSRFALGLFAEASSKPDCGASGNYVQIMLKSNVDEFQVAVFKLVAGAETDTITAFTGGFAFVAAPEYLGIQKKGTSYFFWLYWGSGMRELCGVATHASTMQYVGYTMRGQADAVTPSASFMQADFVRFVDNTTVYQP